MGGSTPDPTSRSRGSRDIGYNHERTRLRLLSLPTPTVTTRPWRIPMQGPPSECGGWDDLTHVLEALQRRTDVGVGKRPDTVPSEGGLDTETPSPGGPSPFRPRSVPPSSPPILPGPSVLNGVEGPRAGGRPGSFLSPTVPLLRNTGVRSPTEARPPTQVPDSGVLLGNL